MLTNVNTQHDAETGRKILGLILKDYHGPVAIRLWDGELAIGGEDAPCTVVFHQPSMLRNLILYRNVVHVAEAYLAGDADIEGNAESLFDLVCYMRDLELSWSIKWRVTRLTYGLPGKRHHTGSDSQVAQAKTEEHSNSRESIAHHYDVSNDFYRLWLDREMVYSCAYFPEVDRSLDKAQRDKLDYICRKLRLIPNQTLLDIGCGWGALAIWAARHYGVRAHGITLSEQQYQYASERVKREGLEGQVTIELRDYRDLSEDARYDRIVSVGMFEHIGVANFPRYFEIIKRALKPEGLFLNHGITNDTGWQDTPITRFINSYVFPDGELTRIGTVISAMEKAGFEVVDVEGLRRHYALTLRSWVQALETNREKAIAMVGEASYRVWRLYMSGSAYYFDEGGINVFQVLAGHDREPLAISLRRDEMYEKGCECSPETNKES